MNPHPRIRKTVKWGGAAVTVLLVVVWIGSGWFGVRRFTLDGPQFRLEAGHIEVATNLGRQQSDPAPQWSLYRTSEQFHWMPRYRSVAAYRWVYVPVWIPVSLLLLITTPAWRLDTLARRRARLNLCPKCSYDRTGLAAGAVCPECGANSTSG